jgi:hypothetical protein
MKKKNTNKIDVILNKNHDDVELGEDEINITTENGVKLKIPYDKVNIEKTGIIEGLSKSFNTFIKKIKKD